MVDLEGGPHIFAETGVRPYFLKRWGTWLRVCTQTLPHFFLKVLAPLYWKIPRSRPETRRVILPISKMRNFGKGKGDIWLIVSRYSNEMDLDQVTTCCWWNKAVELNMECNQGSWSRSILLRRKSPKFYSIFLPIMHHFKIDKILRATFSYRNEPILTTRKWSNWRIIKAQQYCNIINVCI